MESDEEKQKVLWHDSDDENDTGSLRAKRFKASTGNPKWLSAKKHHDDDDDASLLQDSNKIVKSSSKSLPKSTLEYKRIWKVDNAPSGDVTSLHFHPSSTVSMSTLRVGALQLHEIHEKSIKHLHRVAFERFTVTDSALLRGGNEVLVGGPRRHYFSYDLISGTCTRLQPPNEVTNMKRFVVSPCERHFAVAGRFGEVHLFNAATKELIRTFKQEFPCSDLVFSHDSRRLFCQSEDSEVTVFDIGEGRPLHRWTDEGCINGTRIVVSANGRLVATGSRQGVVNVYSADRVMKERCPTPEKAVTNLTTSIAGVAFNASSDILALCSADVPNAVKALHLPSMTVFSNFPERVANLGVVRTMQFSPNGGFLGFAGEKINFYRLKFFGNY